ncbi:PTS sugar transporter subunit IIA [Kiritimatiella glycovorans]|uniref:EIIABC-Fru n=1 Tax=Kiritimatiella glycovorans TaxID=1307763 RepID=A0A0G3EBF4_9BACT|nr:PTS sugar transporter subunit IIA [Kiritimatiella glycovorans]AKJ63628.1 EIIABC-Fru [Kiritimatiella glycovorans]
MNLKKVLSPELVFTDLEAEDKDGLITEMVDRLVARGLLKDRQSALEAVREREAKMSTGMQNGIAIPHGKTGTVEQLVAAVGVKPEGIDFDSLDGRPARIIIMTLSPADRTGPHIQFIAEVGRLLSREEVREAILSARSREEILRALTG